ncbi:GAF domain-containing protein [Chryseolinea lacunae]|uniref:GAF domain-containing protein n=1 Tax=Chryseolinea lacunae TaxID=2801331 RepID=A0ABS1KKY4_9BACT|nr:GAF domain-containing protein [Chryseolinea lacunae]MBL0740124.1 GAF domain-containing protein [Chryseolinea lacunae]
MRNRALKYTLAFALAGLIITLLIGYVQRRTLNTYEHNVPFITLGDNIKNRVTTAHLSFEELMAGDETQNFDRDVIAPIKTSAAILQGTYDGKETELGNLGVIHEEETKALLKESIFALDKLMESAQERWKNRSTGTAGTDSTAAVAGSHAGDAADQQFDAAYETFAGTLDRLVEHIQKDVHADASSLSALSWLSILLLVVGLGALCAFLYRLQSSSMKMVTEHEKRSEEQGRAVSSLSGFIEAISAGDYTADLNLETDDGALGNTLISMRDKLRLNAEEDRRRNWSTSGLAQIGEILRTSTGTTEELFDNIIRFVVKYTKSNQGGLFVLNEESDNEKFLELVACYAFERKKFLKKHMAIGEGLVGQSFLEGERIYLVEVPKEYITITSGLGGSTPNALLLVPLKVNEKIFGVMELATFGKYEPHEIELVEKLTESIASTISSVRISESTRLLLERTQQQAEEMRAQEEEMRQNMEELEATQEEMRRKEKHIQNMLDGEKKRNEISQRNRQVLMELTKNKDIQDGNWNASLEKITSTITRQLGVSRCSIWTYHAKENKILNEKLYQQNKGTFESGTELYGRDFPGYFEAVTSEEIIIAKDAHTHVATREFSDVYLSPLDIQSMLDVPFFNEGKIAGVICCEHQQEQKDWTEEDVEFLKSCADLLTVAFNTSRINRMLEQLSDDQQTMQTIIDNLPRAVFWKDKELRFQGANRIFTQVAGLRSHKDLIGRTDFDMPWKEHGEAYRADDLAVMNSRKARLDHEERNVNSNGEESWVLTSKVPVMNKHGEVVGVLGMFEDITARKHKEADTAAKLKELSELKKRLEKGAE